MRTRPNTDPEHRARRRAQPHVVYSMYDAEGRLLYIGCTWNMQQRLRGHKRAASSQDWVHLVSLIVTEQFPNWSLASQEEERLVHRDRPLFNRMLQRHEYAS